MKLPIAIHRGIFLWGIFFLLAGCATPPSITRVGKEPSLSTKGMQKPDIVVANAREFLEFCVDLDSQDDRLRTGYDAKFNPIQSRVWYKETDSREKVAQALASHSTSHALQNRLQDCPVALSGDAQKDAQALVGDPRCNGFGPFQNAWILYANKDRSAFALAIRGTVITSHPSVVEDLLATTIKAVNGLTIDDTPIRFGMTSSAEVHAGFAYATFSLLFDHDFGALHELLNLPQGAQLYIVGHSQGAAMATLTQALLYFGMEDHLAGLSEGQFQLKSYVFAQPKPGNVDFANDFMYVTNWHGNAIVINNDLDPITRVPFTFELTSDWSYDIGGKPVWLKGIQEVAQIGTSLRSIVSTALQEKIDAYVKTEQIFFFGAPKNGAATHAFNQNGGGVSVNYAAAGLILPLQGDPQALVAHANDPFYQHHATTYRELLKQLDELSGD